jgi:hypothetical protein
MTVIWILFFSASVLYLTKQRLKREKIKDIQSSKTLGLVCGQAKPNMISSLRAAKSKSNELKVIEAKKREGTYTCDKKTLFLDNLVFRYPDALQRSAAISTRQDLQNKETNGNKLIWTTVAEEFMDGTYSGGFVVENEEFL